MESNMKDKKQQAVPQSEAESFGAKRLNPVYISDNQNLTISMVMI